MDTVCKMDTMELKVSVGFSMIIHRGKMSNSLSESPQILEKVLMYRSFTTVILGLSLRLSVRQI